MLWVLSHPRRNPEMKSARLCCLWTFQRTGISPSCHGLTTDPQLDSLSETFQKSSEPAFAARQPCTSQVPCSFSTKKFPRSFLINVKYNASCCTCDFFYVKDRNLSRCSTACKRVCNFCHSTTVLDLSFSLMVLNVLAYSCVQPKYW